MCCGCCGIFNLTTMVVSFSAGFVVASALAFSLFSILEWDVKSQLKNTTDVILHSPEEAFHKGETNYYLDLSGDVRVLCMVLIKSKNPRRARRIKVTWGKRCNELLFFGTQDDPSLPTEPLKFDRSLDSWDVTRKCLNYIYNNESISDFDWILKTDDETYTVVENLRFLLKNYNSSEPIYVDDIIKLDSKETIKLVKLGYVISKSALGMIIQNRKKCEPFGNEMEDHYLNRCFDKIGLKEENSKDCLGRLRFLPLGLGDIFMPHTTHKWTGFYQPIAKKKPFLYTCCSDLAIIFHRVTDYEMYVLEYLIYHLAPFGVFPNINVDLNNCKPVDKLYHLFENKTYKL